MICYVHHHDAILSGKLPSPQPAFISGLQLSVLKVIGISMGPMTVYGLALLAFPTGTGAHIFPVL
jgi:hypothetical protein